MCNKEQITFHYYTDTIDEYNIIIAAVIKHDIKNDIKFKFQEVKEKRVVDIISYATMLWLPKKKENF